jgi:hypothetical protein
MGIVLEFRRTEAPARRAAAPGEGSLGEIVIFPGVRIERYRQAASDAPEEGPPSRRRAQRARKK